jgi:hypothetical protein
MNEMQPPGTGIVTIVSEPEIVNGLYSAEGEIEPHGKSVQVLVWPSADGDYAPIWLGARTLCALTAGVAYVLRVAADETEDAGGADRVIQPRSGGAVKVGARSGGAWEAVMLAARAKAEIVAAWDALDAIVNVVAGLPGGSGITATVNGIKTTLGLPITGGTSSQGLQSRGAS